MLRSLRQGNLLLAFILELGMLAAFCFAGWNLGTVLWLKLALAVGLPVIAIVLWAVWAAPRAGKRRLKMPALMVFKIAMLLAATAAWVVAGQGFIGSIFCALVAINVLGMLGFRQF
jgi:hypothetical protein